MQMILRTVQLILILGLTARAEATSIADHLISQLSSTPGISLLESEATVKGRIADQLIHGELSDLCEGENLGLKMPSDRNMLVLSNLILRAMGLNHAMVAYRSDELKYVTISQERTPLVLILKETDALTPKRINRLIHVLVRRGISVHSLWMGKADSMSVDQLKHLALATGGKVYLYDGLPGLSPQS